MENNKVDLSLSLDHYAIEVIDLEKSLFFYTEILGFPTVERPNFNFKGAWLNVGNHQAIHLIENKEKGIVDSASRKLHFAFSHIDIYKLESYLKKSDVVTFPIKARPDGILQLFVLDPDGYFIEFCMKA
jgi:lactoylglutathione lyase